MFSKSIKFAKNDPIVSILDLFHTDKRENKINLSIGVYKDDTGNVPIFSSVKSAELFLLEHETNKNYISIEGISAFIKSTLNFLFGDLKNSIINEHRIKSVQTLGGTGALRLAADFLVQSTSISRAWVSSPTWLNHKNIFNSAGLINHNYFYYDKNTRTINFDKMMNNLQNANSNDVVVLHACCHNPTGIDLNIDQWNELSLLSIKNGWLPLFDVAYQGLARGLEEDVQGIRIFFKRNPEFIVCNSYSKIFGLYNERIGTCTVISSNRRIADRVLSQLKYHVRTNYSNPPAHGALIVSTILNDINLRAIWETELTIMRNRLSDIRNMFVKNLQNQKLKKNFFFLNKQNGIFSFLNLKKDQIKKLQNKFGIYIVSPGRMNITDITKENVSLLCKGILSVL